MLDMKPKLYVYRDDAYCSMWITEDGSEKITDLLTQKGAEQIDTTGLVNIMNDGIKKPYTDIVIVFSQDIMPDKVLDNISTPTPNSLFRRFLNAGHTIIWLGDEPACHVGLPNKKHQPLPQPQTIRHLIGNPQLVPTRTGNKSVLVKPTLEGLLVGMEPWRGKRPHKPLPPSYNFIPLGVSGEGVHSYIYSPIPVSQTLSGMIRLYDFDPISSKTLSSEMLETIFNIASRKFLFNEITFLNKQFNLLRKEVDEKIMNKLDKIIEEIKKIQKVDIST